MTRHADMPPVVVGVSGPDSLDALDWAADEAGRRGRPVRLVHSVQWVLAEALGAGDRLQAELAAEGHRLLNRAATRVATRAPGVAVEAVLDSDADPATALLTRSTDADLVVLGSKGRSLLGDLVAASATTVTVAHATCPVVVVPEGGGATPGGPVVVGVDGSTGSRLALERAFVEAAAWGTSLVAVQAWQTPQVFSGELAVYGVLTEPERASVTASHEAVLTTALAPWQRAFPAVPVTARVVEGRAGPVLTEAARGARLLVVGSRGRGPLAGLVLGSVSAAALHHARCPVMVCHRAPTGPQPQPRRGRRRLTPA